MLADIPASLDQIAKHLNVSRQTLSRYIRADQAPRPVMLSLFWETRWGRSAADTEAANFGILNFRQARGLERELDTMRRQLARLELELSMADTVAANGPIWRVG